MLTTTMTGELDRVTTSSLPHIRVTTASSLPDVLVTTTSSVHDDDSDDVVTTTGLHVGDILTTARKLQEEGLTTLKSSLELRHPAQLRWYHTQDVDVIDFVCAAKRE